MSEGRTVFNRRASNGRVPEMIKDVQVECTFPDGTKLVSNSLTYCVGNNMIPGEIRVNAALGDIELNAGRETKPYRWLIMAR